jgi:branched-chain amino acid transport system ATP-binding protein
LERRIEVLTLRGIQVSYGGSAALRGVDLSVGAGELVAVIGPNGAGKTTLLRTISGIVPRQSGTAVFEGRDLGALRADEIVRLGIVHVPEGRMVLGRMSVRENLLLGAYSRPRGEATAEDLDHVLGLFPRVKERLDQLAGTLSGGEQQMVAIGRGLMSRPRLLMLDEPSLGLAPIITERIFEALLDIKGRGVTVLLVEQNAEKALSIAERGYVLDLGSVAAHGPACDLLRDERVRQAYLGV